MKRAITIVLALVIGGFLYMGDSHSQPQDPWWNPLNPFGSSQGVSYGTVAPSLATTGNPATHGQLWIQVDVGNTVPPVLNIYDDSTQSWVGVGAGLTPGALTDQVIPKYDLATTDLVDSNFSEDASGNLVFPDSIGGLGQDNVAKFGVADPLWVGYSTNPFPIGFVQGPSIVGVSSKDQTLIGSGTDGPLAPFSDNNLTIFEANAAGTGTTTASLVTNLGAMGGGNATYLFDLAPVNAVHAGGSFLIGYNANLAAGSAATEYAYRLEGNWDYGFLSTSPGPALADIFLVDAQAHIRYQTRLTIASQDKPLVGQIDLQPGLINILPDNTSAADGQFTLYETQPAGLQTSWVEQTAQQNASNGNDTDAGYLSNFTTTTPSGGANNFFYNFFSTINAERANQFEAAYAATDVYDAHLVFSALGHVPGENPFTNWVSIFVGEAADYSGGGGNDCALVAQLSTGVVVPITILVLNGPCP